MKYIRTLEFSDVHGSTRRLHLCAGDATEPAPAGQIDLLGLSCFRDSYVPTPDTIVRALARRGISVSRAAHDKARDFRGKWHTWISEPLPAGPFGRLVCFEHGKSWLELDRGARVVNPASVVGDVFRAVSEFVLEGPQAAGARTEFGTFRLPLLSTGNQRADKSQMLEAIVRQAYSSLRGGLPVRDLEIVLYHLDPELLTLVAEAVVTLESAHRDWHFKRLSAHEQYDFFVSYRRVDEEFVKQLLSGMKARRPDLNIFVDQERLKHGVCWKPELVGSIYNARRALCVVTDTYPDSAECIDEFHVALCCSHHRAGFLRPIVRLHHRTLDSLPATIRKVNLIDGHCPPRQISQVIDAVLDAGT